jgi:putative sigma-54 modulation protein
MRLELTGRHVDITPGIRRIVDSKLLKLTRLLNDGAISAHIVLSKEKTFNRAEVTVHLRDEKFLHAVGEGAAWQAPLARATERLAQQARTTKGKYQSRKRKNGGERRGEQYSDVVPTARRPAVAADTLARLPAVRQLRQKVKLLSIVSAVQQLREEGILIFRDSSTARLSVLYRATDGDLTLVEADVDR